jgi:hypothetical protein
MRSFSNERFNALQITIAYHFLIRSHIRMGHSNLILHREWPNMSFSYLLSNFSRHGCETLIFLEIFLSIDSLRSIGIIFFNYRLLLYRYIPPLLIIFLSIGVVVGSPQPFRNFLSIGSFSISSSPLHLRNFLKYKLLLQGYVLFNP